MTNSPLLNSPLGLIKSIRQFSQLRRKCEGEIATAKRFSSTPAINGGFCAAKRRKNRPVEAEGRNEFDCLVKIYFDAAGNRSFYVQAFLDGGNSMQVAKIELALRA